MKVELVKEEKDLIVGHLYKVISVKKEDDHFHYKILFTEGDILKTKWISSKICRYPFAKFVNKN